MGARETARYGLNPRQGRGATDINLMDAVPGGRKLSYQDKIDKGLCDPVPDYVVQALSQQLPAVATSVQLGPGIPKWADEVEKRVCLTGRPTGGR